uniref:Uncharacterized protein n=1 Tax=Geospiza parvula TaxID=87175 RepID=A0A8U8B439_GEOPR
FVELARALRAALGAARTAIVTAARRSVTLIAACASGVSSFQSVWEPVGCIIKRSFISQKYLLIKYIFLLFLSYGNDRLL